MTATIIQVTLIGGPTVLIEVAGLRLLTDPTFDPAGTSYTTSAYTLRKTTSPAISAKDLGTIDIVLLSHDHHFDNLDNAGREILALAGRTLTTTEGAGRLGGNASALIPWQCVDFETPSGRTLRITGTPARHGPEHGDRGPVVGFVLSFADSPERGVYLSGDTVWYEGVREVSRRFRVDTAVLYMGAARVAAAGDSALTFTANDGVQAAQAFADAMVIPIHYEGWEHFSESRSEVEREFAEAGLSHRLKWLEAGLATQVANL